MTESSPVSHIQPEQNARLGGCGHPVPSTIAKVVDIDTGAALPPNTDGELLVAGPQVRTTPCKEFLLNFYLACTCMWFGEVYSCSCLPIKNKLHPTNSKPSRLNVKATFIMKWPFLRCPFSIVSQ